MKNIILNSPIKLAYELTSGNTLRIDDMIRVFRGRFTIDSHEIQRLFSIHTKDLHYFVVCFGGWKDGEPVHMLPCDSFKALYEKKDEK